VKYEGYIARQQDEIEKQQRNENTLAAGNAGLSSGDGLSNEVIAKLNDHKPSSIGQASRISGITPAAISILLVWLKKQGCCAAAPDCQCRGFRLHNRVRLYHSGPVSVSASGLIIFDRYTVLNKLSRLLDEAGISLTDHQKNQLVAYVGMLDKWNKAYNLTSVRDPNEMLVRHILDSIVVAPYLQGALYRCRYGTGAAGIPLAIVRPESISRCWTALASACASCVRCSMS
jgi:hypothetical protein